MMAEEGNICISCGENVCLFLQFQADVANLQRWHKRAAALATNRDRRKHAFRTYFKRSCDVGGRRKELEKCVVIGVRPMYPSCAYMGFYGDEDRSLRRRAVDMEGNQIDLRWEFRDGAWELAEE